VCKVRKEFKDRRVIKVNRVLLVLKEQSVHKVRRVFKVQ
jgi:hypothetical protein